MHEGTNPCENGGGICTKMKRRLKSAAFSIVILAAVLAATVFGGGIVVLLILLMELLPLYSQLFQRRRAAGSVVKLFRGQKENKRVTMKVQNS